MFHFFFFLMLLFPSHHRTNHPVHRIGPETPICEQH